MATGELVLWGLAALCYGVGDWVTTVWPSEDLEEQAPLPRAVFGPHPDAVSFAVFKPLLLAGAYLLYSLLPPQGASVEVRLLIPAVCTVVGVVATTNNLYHHLTATAET